MKILRRIKGRILCLTGRHEWLIEEIHLSEISITSDGTFALGGTSVGPVRCAYCRRDRP